MSQDDNTEKIFPAIVQDDIPEFDTAAEDDIMKTIREECENAADTLFVESLADLYRMSREVTPVNLTFKDIDKLHESWDRKKHKHLIEYVADTLKCKMQDVPSVYIDWCIAKATESNDYRER